MIAGPASRHDDAAPPSPGCTAFPSRDLRAQPNSASSAYAKKILVEPARMFIEHRAPVHGRASVRPQDFFHAIILPFIQLAAAPPSILSIRINQVTRFVDPARIFCTRILEAAMPTSGRPSNALAKFRQPIRFRFRVIIEKRDEFRCSDAAKPWLFAAQKPRFSRFRITPRLNSR